MKTWPIIGEGGEAVAFEVSMLQSSLTRIRNIIQSNPDASRITCRPRFSGSEIHISFEYRGAEYAVWEPFGDNSRYWITPVNSAPNPVDVASLRGYFDSYPPSLRERMFGWAERDIFGRL